MFLDTSGTTDCLQMLPLEFFSGTFPEKGVPGFLAAAVSCHLSVLQPFRMPSYYHTSATLSPDNYQGCPPSALFPQLIAFCFSISWSHSWLCPPVTALLALLCLMCCLDISGLGPSALHLACCWMIPELFHPPAACPGSPSCCLLHLALDCVISSLSHTDGIPLASV